AGGGDPGGRETAYGVGRRRGRRRSRRRGKEFPHLNLLLGVECVTQGDTSREVIDTRPGRMLGEFRQIGSSRRALPQNRERLGEIDFTGEQVDPDRLETVAPFVLDARRNRWTLRDGQGG